MDKKAGFNLMIGTNYALGYYLIVDKT